MIDVIKEKLREIELSESIIILLAVESGSRAWGFASPDSDYDVRFIYVRPKEFYLQLNKIRDVIEFVLNDELDINGWDFNKTLRLLHSSNPTLFEWLSSPVVYLKHPFIQKLIDKSLDYFLAKAGLYHYLSMAERNYREFFKGETVKLKRYFYVLRPILACKHILKNQTPPPMKFEDLLYAQTDQSVIPTVEQLLLIKKSTPEIGEGAKIKALDDYIEDNIQVLKSEISLLPEDPKKNWNTLNSLFLEALELSENLV
jgi:predicted nucleotidyltransferase